MQLWFKNQLIIDEKIHPESGEDYAPGWWNGKRFHDSTTPWSKSKRAVISSVGCVFAAKP